VPALSRCLPSVIGVTSALFTHKPSSSLLSATLNLFCEKLGQLYTLSTSGSAGVFTPKIANKVKKLIILSCNSILFLDF
jgi:hypothetical protein